MMNKIVAVIMLSLFVAGCAEIVAGVVGGVVVHEYDIHRHHCSSQYFDGAHYSVAPDRPALWCR